MANVHLVTPIAYASPGRGFQGQRYGGTVGLTWEVPVTTHGSGKNRDGEIERGRRLTTFHQRGRKDPQYAFLADRLLRDVDSSSSALERSLQIAFPHVCDYSRQSLPYLN